MPGFLGHLEELLPTHISSSRWYRSKTRTIGRTLVRDIVPLGQGFFLLVVDIEYPEKDTDRYVLPIDLSAAAGTELETSGAREALSRDALGNPRFRDVLLQAIASNTTFTGRAGKFIAAHTSVFSVPSATLESFVSRAEQSNTSIIYPGHFIFKLFRKIEPGVNPDLEIGRFLTEQGFRNTPAFLGSLEYQQDGATYSAGILQQFVPNHGDAWKYTLEELASFFERVTSTPESPNLLGNYLSSARLLGARTAQMHTALLGSSELDFAPEPFTADDAGELYRAMLAQADAAFQLLHAKAGTLPEGTAVMARQVIALEPQLRERFARLDKITTSRAVRIRTHGDYHLGQVLYTGEDFMIIDFEGEPARPLSERRSKGLALRDVAGMLRSFDYAVHAAPEARGKDPAWPAFWLTQVNDSYLKGYYETAGDQTYISSDADENQLFLDIFLLQKALYEVAYELNNRPDWVHIPLRGILSIFSTSPNAD